MSADSDDAIEALLRQDFDVQVEDDGFTAHVMRALPRSHCYGGWLSPVGMAVGAGLCWMTLRSSPIILSAWHDWLSGRLSESAGSVMIVPMGLSALGLMWAISEAAEDHRHALA